MALDGGRARGRNAPTMETGPRPRPEIGGIATLGGIAFAAFGVARLASEIAEGETRAFDTGIMTALRRSGDLAQPIGPSWLPATMLDLTALGGTAVLTLLTVLATGFLIAQRKWRRAAFLVGAISGGALLNVVLKIGYARPRPAIVAHLVKVHDLSFPSGHAMNSAVVYLTLGVLLARAQSGRQVKLYLLGAAALLTLIVGVSRVYLGVHYPTDVLAGWTVGAGWATLCWWIAEWWRRRRPPGAPPV